METIKITGEEINEQQIKENLYSWLRSYPVPLRKVLLLPPDITRAHSMAGLITRLIYEFLAPDCQVDIMPALGTHLPMSTDEKRKMFGPDIPLDCFHVHDWRNDIVKIGQIPGAYVAEVSGNRLDFAIDVEINRRLLDKSYDLVLSIGQVVPHEVVGMANYSKNTLVGCGGKEIIDKSHFLGAVCGMEALMGRDHTPVRKVFDYAETHFLKDIPLAYILTVTTTKEEKTKLNGLFIGRERQIFEAAVAESQKRNLDLLDEPLKKVIVYLDPNEFKSTWVGNKAIYRTRMAMADEGDLYIIAPGLRQFGEDKVFDQLIRKYGYIGTPRILELVQTEADLQNNLSAAAHLIHGSSEGRFRITYAPGHLSKAEIEGVNFNYLPLEEAQERFDYTKLHDGFNRLKDGEEVFFISNPALGLWALKENFNR